MPIGFNDVDMYVSIKEVKPKEPLWRLKATADDHFTEIKTLSDGTPIQLIYQNPAAHILEHTFFSNRKIALCQEPAVVYTKTCIALDLESYPTNHTAEGILASYDLSICQVTIHYGERSGYVVTLTKGCAESISKKQLAATARHFELMTWVKDLHNKDLLRHGCITAKRLCKYVQKTGFTMDPFLYELNKVLLERAIDYGAVVLVEHEPDPKKDYYLTSEIDPKTASFYQITDYKPSWARISDKRGIAGSMIMAGFEGDPYTPPSTGHAEGLPSSLGDTTVDTGSDYDSLSSIY